MTPPLTSSTEASNGAGGGGQLVGPAASSRIGLGPGVSGRTTELQLPPCLPMGAWARIGRQIGLLSSCSAWWLGDWLIYGRENFPDRYRQAIAATSLDYQT